MVDTMQSRMQILMEGMKTMAKVDEDMGLDGQQQSRVVTAIEADDEKRQAVAKGCMESMQFLLNKATGKREQEDQTVEENA